MGRPEYEVGTNISAVYIQQTVSVLYCFSIPTFLHKAAGPDKQSLFMRRILLELLTTNAYEIIDIYLSPLAFSLLNGTTFLGN